MRLQPIRIYADTSVFGGVFDPEFSNASRKFFENVRSGIFRLVSSELVREELESAPAEVLGLFEEMMESAEIAQVSADALRLREAYHRADVISRKWAADAFHVALATASECALIVSWNFKHIVHFQRIPRYNAVNTLEGFHHLRIHSPLELVEHG